MNQSLPAPLPVSETARYRFPGSERTAPSHLHSAVPSTVHSREAEADLEPPRKRLRFTSVDATDHGSQWSPIDVDGTGVQEDNGADDDVDADYHIEEQPSGQEEHVRSSPEVTETAPCVVPVPVQCPVQNAGRLLPPPPAPPTVRESQGALCGEPVQEKQGRGFELRTNAARFVVSIFTISRLMPHDDDP